MAQPSMQCKKRLEIEYKKVTADPPEFIRIAPDPANILSCYYCLHGPPGTPYEGGVYLGVVVFPCQYPFAPPAIQMITPSGRFQTRQRICLSISDYHPETWNPIWGISSILVGLLSFMVGNESAAGSMVSTDAEYRRSAKASHAFNATDPTFARLFPAEHAAALKYVADNPGETNIERKPSKTRGPKKRGREE